MDGETSINATFPLVAQGFTNFHALGIDDKCAFKPDRKEFKQYLEKLNDLEALSLYEGNQPRESVAVLKLSLIASGLRADETLEMVVPTKMYSSDGTPLTTSIFMTASPGTMKSIRYQLMRTKSTSGLWGFSLGGVGDQYTADISLAWKYDEVSQKMHRSDLSNAVYLQYAFSPLIEEVKRAPISIFTALSKIGGLLALFQFSAILSDIHSKRFYKKINAKVLMKKESIHPVSINGGLNQSQADLTEAQSLITDGDDVRELLSYENMVLALKHIDQHQEILREYQI